MKSSIKKYRQIVIFTSETYPSVAGDGRSALLLGSRLAGKGYNVSLVCLNPNGLLKRKESINGVAIERVAYHYKSVLGRLVYRFRLFKHLLKIDGKDSIGLIFGAMPGFRTIILVSILKGRDFIFRSTLWGFDDALTLAGKPYRFCTRFLLGKAKGYYALNSSFSSSWKKIFSSSPIFQSAQGVLLERFSNTEKHQIREQVRNELGIARKQLVILMVGHLIRRKGFPEIIDWLKRTNEHFVLLHIGSIEATKWDTVSQHNDEMKYIRLYTEKVLGERVNLLGRQDDVAKFYYAADIFLMASYAEGYPPNSVNEALAAGLPIVTRKIPGVSDTITDGLNGYVFNDEKEFSFKLSILIHNQVKREELGRNASIFARDKLDIDKVTTSFQNFLGQLAK